MMTITEFEYLCHLFDDSKTDYIYKVLSHSEIRIEGSGPPYFYLTLNLLCDPEIYKIYSGSKDEITGRILSKIEGTFENLHKIKKVNLIPDLSRFQLLNNQYQTIQTPWHDINSDQELILSMLKSAQSAIQVQNIGNTGRTILQKIANHLFDSSKHCEPGKDIPAGKYKNRLHAIIKYNLKDFSRSEFQEYANSQIETAEKSVDLANTLTHSLNAFQALAELCVISVLSVVSVMKVIHGLKEQ